MTDSTGIFAYQTVCVSYDLCSSNKGLFLLGTLKLREGLLTALNNIDTLTLAPPATSSVSPSELRHGREVSLNLSSPHTLAWRRHALLTAATLPRVVVVLLLRLWRRGAIKADWRMYPKLQLTQS